VCVCVCTCASSSSYKATTYNHWGTHPDAII
jgi:hypothetical protein